jgi:hypothetical protein
MMHRRLATPRHFFSPLRSLVAVVLVLVVMATLSGACESGHGTTEPAEFPVRFVVSNNLIAPVTISVDAVPAVGLQGGGSSGLTVSSSAQWLTWMSAKPMDSQGQPIPDDIGEVQIAVAGINGRLDISNVIGDQTYITARIFNQTDAPVSIGVYDGASVSCAAELRARSGVVSGFTQIGYYKLLPATEVRAYRESHCGGPYVPWPSSQLKGFTAKSGLLTLTLASAP